MPAPQFERCRLLISKSPATVHIVDPSTYHDLGVGGVAGGPCSVSGHLLGLSSLN